MELTHHELPSGWIAAGYIDDKGRFWHVATVRRDTSEDAIKVATLRTMGALDTFVLAVRKLVDGVTSLFRHAEVDVLRINASETWHIRLAGASALGTALVLDVTERTVLLRFEPGCSPVRYALDDVEFIEKADK